MDVTHLSFIVDIASVFILALILMGIIAFLRTKKNKSFTYLTVFTVFYVYIITVLYYTQFQYQSLFLLNYLVPGHLILRGDTPWESMNLTPLIKLTLGDARTSFLNILLFIPFGFGLPFLANLGMRKVVIIGALFSITIELLQLMTGVISKTTFRSADVNDVIFNTLGVGIGYLLFALIVRVFPNIKQFLY